MENEITLSVISHGQLSLVEKLFCSLEKIGFQGKIICTINKGTEVLENNYNLDIVFINNILPLGFGENHNNAFKNCSTKYFSIVNPDVEFLNNIFPSLISTLQINKKVGVIGAGSINNIGIQQDNARNFPTIFSLFLKLLGFHTYLKYSKSDGLIEPDWISGQFMFFESNVFSEIEGFSSKYFLYYEDVDLCKRLRHLGYSVLLDTELTIIHDAQRSSHFNPKLFFIHLKSAFKYYFT